MRDAPLRIAMVTNNYTPYNGGVVSAIDTMTTSLRAYGHDVIVITLNFLGTKHQDVSGVFRVHCPIKFKYKTNYMAIPWRAHRYIDAIVASYKPTIIHSHHPTLLGLSARDVATKYAIPLVFTYHSMYESYAHYLPLPTAFTKPIIRKTVNAYCARVQGIIVPTKPIVQLLLQQGVTTPMQIIPTGINPLFLGPYTKKTMDSDRISLLYVGRFAHEKNLHQLLQLLFLLKQRGVNFTCQLIGFGPEYEALRAYAYTTLRLDPQAVTFEHKPDKQYIAHAYKQADLFLFTSTTDTQALVLAEAMAGGTPVIALPGPGQQAIVEQGVNGFLVSSLHEMADTIQFLINNPGKYAQMCEAAWHTAQRYAPDKTVQELIAFYNQVSNA